VGYWHHQTVSATVCLSLHPVNRVVPLIIFIYDDFLPGDAFRVAIRQFLEAEKEIVMLKVEAFVVKNSCIP